MKNFKILIINHFGTNKGDASILIGIVDLLVKVIPNVKISIESADPEITDERTGHRFGIVKRIISRKNNITPLIWWLKTIIWIFQSTIWALLRRFGLDIKWFFNKQKRAILQEYEKSDLVLSVGGGYINDTTGLVGFLPLYSIMLAIIIQKPIMLYAQSIGPIGNIKFRFLTRYILNKVNLITLREEISRKVLQNLKINIPTIYVTSDAAFMFHKNVQSLRAEFILNKEGINKKENRLIGVTLMRWHYPGDRNAESKHENYKLTMAEALDNIIEKLDVTVIFISMNTNKQREEEINLAKEIIQIMKYKQNSKVITGEYTPEEIKDIISQLDLVVGTRFHSIIFALTTGVPVVSIMYEHKAMGIMKMLNFEKYVCDISDLKKEELVSKIDEVYGKRNEIRTIINSKVPILQNLALINAKLLKQLINCKNKADINKNMELSYEDNSILSLYN